MTERCLTLGCPEVVRLGLMDPCNGTPTSGGENGYALGCPRNVTLEPIIREGEVAEFVSDCGNVGARDKQDDQPLGWTISFETATRSNELQSLVTGESLIVDTGVNIGTIALANFGCTTAASDPRFTVELFYKLAKCATGADHVRFVIPNVQFGVTELDKEGTISYYRYTGTSQPSLGEPLVTGNAGPFDDFPASVVTALTALTTTDYITHLSFEETITITGSCGTIAVPA